tara:strand:+ start:2020 stop:2637 length:618 start_codon:yes stop_codon:yes gene_type:complete
MRKILLDVLKMPYYRNHQAISGAVHNISKHEDAVKDIFIAHSLKEIFQKITKKQRDLWLENPHSCTLVEGTFVFQPCGQNDSPDFIVKLGGRAYFIECKSVKGRTTAPMYNSGVPKTGYIYVFTAERYNETTIYFGEDVCPSEDYATFQELIEEHRKLDKKYNGKFINDFGIQHYTRPMIKHVGGTNYFENEHRQHIEQGVLSAV